MSCELCRDAINDVIDDRVHDLGDDVDEHLESCVTCREFADAAYALRRATSIGATGGQLPIDTGSIVRRAAAADRDVHSPVVRWLLGLVAAQILVFAIPDFLAGSSSDHSLRHLGAFSLAYAAGLLFVVVRPARARTMFNVSLVLLGALAATTAIDVIQGRIPLTDELPHLLELCAAWFLWMLSRPAQEPVDDRAATADDEPAPLRLVRTDSE